MYLDDVKLLPVTATAAEAIRRNSGFSAYYEKRDQKIYAMHLPENCREVRLYDLLGHLLQEVDVFGNTAVLDSGNTPTGIYILRAITREGEAQSLKVLKN